MSVNRSQSLTTKPKTSKLVSILFLVTLLSKTTFAISSKSTFVIARPDRCDDQRLDNKKQLYKRNIRAFRGGSTTEFSENTQDSKGTTEEMGQVTVDAAVKEDTPTQSSLSKIASAVFPIERNEVKKFLLMGAIKFFVIMALTLTRDTKDTLVVTQCGAEAIAFLKVSLLFDFTFVS